MIRRDEVAYIVGCEKVDEIMRVLDFEGFDELFFVEQQDEITEIVESGVGNAVRIVDVRYIGPDGAGASLRDPLKGDSYQPVPERILAIGVATRNMETNKSCLTVWSVFTGDVVSAISQCHGQRMNNLISLMNSKLSVDQLCTAFSAMFGGVWQGEKDESATTEGIDESEIDSSIILKANKKCIRGFESSVNIMIDTP